MVTREQEQLSGADSSVGQLVERLSAQVLVGARRNGAGYRRDETQGCPSRCRDRAGAQLDAGSARAGYAEQKRDIDSEGEHAPMSTRSEQELQEEIKELRGELGGIVQALVHKADVPARAKQRGNELKEEAIERGIELHDQVVGRSNELKGQVVGYSSELREQAAVRGSELRDRVGEAAERAREAVSRTPRGRWAKLTGGGLALIALTVIVRRVRAS